MVILKIFKIWKFVVLQYVKHWFQQLLSLVKKSLKRILWPQLAHKTAQVSNVEVIQLFS